MARVEWTPKARRSLEQIATYIARHDNRPSVADRLIDDICKKCDLHASQPEMDAENLALPDGFR